MKSLILFTLIFSTLPTLAQRDLYLGSEHLKFFTAPSPNPFADIIDEINQAKKSITMTIFGISEERVVQALENALKRNVDVKILIERKATLLPSVRKMVKRLTKAGAQFTKSTKAFRVTHMKSMIVDQEVGLISTMNFTENAEKYLDMGLLIRHPEIVQEMVSVFEADLKNAQDHTGNIPHIRDHYLIWSPANAKSRLIELIDSAQNDLILAVENLDDPDIIQAVKTKAKSGVPTRFMLPACNKASLSNHNITHAIEMREHGVDARMMPEPESVELPYVHTKFIVTDKKTIYLGSENFSTNSLTRNRELGIIFENPSIVKRIQNLFDQNWPKTIEPENVSRIFCR